MIGIIDYKAGNAHSVQNALGHLGIPCKMVAAPQDLEGLSGILLPGVGSAKATMDSLQKQELIDGLNEAVLEQKIPFLGICVGLQILFDHSQEGDTGCFGWLPGQVKRFSSPGLRVPQIGWNKVDFPRETSLSRDIPEESYFYFVNSYYVIPDEHSLVAGITEYGFPFCSMAHKDNIFGTQFHLEKSGPVGLKMLRNFWDHTQGVTGC